MDSRRALNQTHKNAEDKSRNILLTAEELFYASVIQIMVNGAYSVTHIVCPCVRASVPFLSGL